MLQNENLNYCATIIEVKDLHQLEGLDNLVGVRALGCQALVDKTTQVGDIGVLFVSETQLSPEFAKVNNLYRKQEFNSDASKTGYLEEKARIKALKLRGNISTGLFLPLSSLDYLGYDFKVGDTFTHVNGKMVCKKYIIREQEQRIPKAKKQRLVKRTRVEPKLFPAHFDTTRYFGNEGLFNDDDYVTVTAKLHGTSFRACHQRVNKLNMFDKLGNKYTKFFRLFGMLSKWRKKFIPEQYVWKCVPGSRKVIKDEFAGEGYYKHDLWTETLNEIQHLVPKGYVFYGEIIGVAGGAPIQDHFTYGATKPELFIYRISTVNEDGFQTDLCWNSMVQLCDKLGLRTVPLLWRGLHKDFDVNKWMDVAYADLGFDSPRPEMGFDEGVIIRRDGMIPLFLKAKCDKFLLFEGKQTRMDIETEQSLETENELN